MKTTALITGATGGLGFEFARLLAAEGCDLVLVARNGEHLTAIAKELSEKFGIAATAHPADLTEPAAADQLYAALGRSGTAVDLLVNNAGFGDWGPFAETDGDKELRMIALNVTALTRLTKLFLRGMLARGRGGVLNVASTAAFQPGPLMAVYFATKAYVLSFSEALHAETRGGGVTVTCLCPGPTATGFVSAANLRHSRLFSVLKPARAADVAKFGWMALKRRKAVAVHGLANRLMVFGLRFVPRFVAPKLARLFLERE